MLACSILYVVHSIPKYEKNGTPYAAWRVATKIRDMHPNTKIGFLIPTPNGELGKELVDEIAVYKVPLIDFHDNFFHDHRRDRSEYLRYIDEAIVDFNPDIIHIYNFVRMSYQILYLKKKYTNISFIRTFTHTEDICFNIDPLLPDTIDDRLQYCSGPFPIFKCALHYNRSFSKISEQEIVKSIALHCSYVERLHELFVSNIVFTTQHFADFMSTILRLSSEKIRIVPHGIIRSYESVRQPTIHSEHLPVKVCFIGGTNPRKGLGLVLDVINEDPSLLDNMQLTVIGHLEKNKLFDQLMKEKEQLGDRLRILGLVEEATLVEEMREADIALLPTYFETYNLTLREILLAGTPVIVGNTFGADIIQSGFNGFIFSNGQKDSLANVLRTINADPSILTELKRNVSQTHIPVLEDECNQIINIYMENIYK